MNKVMNYRGFIQSLNYNRKMRGTRFTVKNGELRTVKSDLCPTCWLALVKTKQRFDNSRFNSAAKVLNFTDVDKVVDYADELHTALLDKEGRSLLRACGITNKTIKRLQKQYQANNW